MTPLHPLDVMRPGQTWTDAEWTLIHWCALRLAVKHPRDRAIALATLGHYARRAISSKVTGIT